MKAVQFRFLQLILNHVTGDRVSVALVYWDGTTLRVEQTLDHVRLVMPGQREAVRASISAFVQRARKVAKRLARDPELDLGLEAIFRVREGLGGALYWAPVCAIQVADPELHFAKLVEDLRGPRAARHRKKRVTERRLREEIGAAAKELASARPKRVKLDHRVSKAQDYVSPLSWKNGKWHHAVPFSFDGLSAEEMDREAQLILGLARLSIPERDVPVLVPVFPDDKKLAARARRGARAVCHDLRDRGCDLVPAKRKGDKLFLKSLVARVERDIREDESRG